MSKTEREIKLEKEVIQEWDDKPDNILRKAFEEALDGGLERERIHLARALRAEKKLDIAVTALQEYADEECWEDTYVGNKNSTENYIWCKKGGLCSYGYLTAQQALKEIEK